MRATSRFPTPKAPSFIAVNKKTGKVVWSDASPGEHIMHGQWSNPAYAEVSGKPQVIFPGGDGWLYAFDPETGKLIWKFDCNPKDAGLQARRRAATRNDFIATPVVYDNQLYIGVGQDPEHDEGVGHFWCIDLGEGDAIRSRTCRQRPDPGQRQLRPEGPGEPEFGPGLALRRPARRANAERDYIFGRTLSTAAVHDGLVYIGELDGYCPLPRRQDRASNTGNTA